MNTKIIDFCKKKEAEIEYRLKEIDEIADYNQIKVLNAMKHARLSDTDFTNTTGYGYDDVGREKLEKIYANVFNTESAIVRPSIVSGTHALATTLFGILRPGDELMSPVGAPYDTLEEVIGIRESKGSLKEFGISYSQVDLIDDKINYEGIRKAINEKTKLVTIQRSKGYATRHSLSVNEIGELIKFIKDINPKIICMVDNCYGEFVEKNEPTDVGADIVVGSLIKNPGGGLAPIGGYIVGKEEYIDLISYRLTAPGLGREVGATLGLSRVILQGLFFAPTVVAAAHKTALYAAKIYQDLGYEVYPKFEEKRTDIIQSIVLGSEEKILKFCKGIQSAAPVDSFVIPLGAYMPGYEDDVVMAAGTFIQGASIELSADAPIRDPYAVYFQGGLTWAHGKYGIMSTLEEIGINPII